MGSHEDIGWFINLRVPGDVFAQEDGICCSVLELLQRWLLGVRWSLIYYIFDESATVWSIEVVLAVDTLGEAAEAAHQDLNLLELRLLTENVHDKLNRLVRVKVSHKLLIKTLLDQIDVKHITQAAVDVLWPTVESNDEFIPDLSIVLSVDLEGQIDSGLSNW